MARFLGSFERDATDHCVRRARDGRSGRPTASSLFRVPALAGDVEAVVDVLGLERIVLVGHSMGASIALEYAARHPGRVAGLVLVDGGTHRKATWRPVPCCSWSSDHMVPVAEQLARSHRVVLFDQRGTGLSRPAELDGTTISIRTMIEDIEAVRTSLGIAEWVVMGHSFGGLRAMAYAAQHPEPVRALILSAPGGANLDFLAYYPASLNDRMQRHEREAVAYWSDPARMTADPGKSSYEIVRASIGAFPFDRSHLPEMLRYITEDTWSIETSTVPGW